MVFPKIRLAQSIIEICAAHEVFTIVIAPGSRNAPLTIGFVNNPAFSCYSIADERCAAFFAMGIAQQTKKPVAVVCTSGSALLNFYPALAEAFYSQIPLIVISADRPLDKIDIGDGQTIRQRDVFRNHSLYNANLHEEASSDNDYILHQALHIAKTQNGPVHINAPFEEPLYETVSELSIAGTPYEPASVPEPQTDFAAFADRWNTAGRKMILVGVNEPDALDPEIIALLAADPSVLVLTETTSNLHHVSFINNIDTIITPFTAVDFENFRPDLLVTFGGMIVSKRLKAFLRQYPPAAHWHIDTLRAYDTFGALTDTVALDPNRFFAQLAPLMQPVTSDYSERGRQIQQYRSVKHKQYLAKIPFSDFKVFEMVLPALAANSQLQISNSSAIRYAQLIDIDPSIQVYCNRGTSGIDGSTSTAVGAAVGSKRQTTLITGDIGFLYDSNALWNAYIPKDFKIILINNGGGGIFRILPGHQETPVFNTFFETSHCLTAEHLARMYGFDYYTASDVPTLQHGLKALYEQKDKPVILEVFTPTLENDRILQQYFKELV